jgi:hypothetical protein
MKMRLPLLLGFAILAASAPLRAGPPAEAPAAMAGTWDLIWQTRHGPERKGYLVVRQFGARLEAEIHGQGQVKAKGAMAGNVFTLRGSRMMVPYVISGRVDDGRLTGSLKILSVERRFIGARR